MPYSDSDPVEATLSLTGVWLHDPLDAEGTVRNYLYGGASRSTGLDVASAPVRYAGRTFPVYDYGEAEDEKIGVAIDVPHGETWAGQLADLTAFARARRTLVYRDNRGRDVYGTLAGYNEDDAEWGTGVSFDFTRVDYDQGDEVTV